MKANASFSLAHGNRLQRRYHAWAQPYYQRMAPALRTEAEAIDAFLYSRRGLGFWLGLLGAWAGGTAGLIGAGMPWWLSAGLSLMLLVSLGVMVLSAWLAPEKFRGALHWKRLSVFVLLGMLGGVLGFAFGHAMRHGSWDGAAIAQRLWEKIAIFVPAVALTAVAMLALAWMVARVRRDLSEREVLRLTLERERDQAQAAATEAQLKLLQAQIQPHFLFNTLATLQHWVDNQDSRGGPLLRELTAFLRGSTESLGRPVVSLGEEAAQAQRYLHIMQARLGSRLRYALDLPEGLARQPLPPALLLSLVENAIEHGIEPALHGGEVRIGAATEGDEVLLRVQDSGAGLLAAAPPEGVGLGNSRRRLKALHGERASLTLAALAPQGAQVTVRWPLAAGEPATAYAQ